MEPLSKGCERCGSPGPALMRRGQETELLCASCLDREMPTIQPGAIARAMRRPRRHDGRCPNCGWTEAEAHATHHMGCPLCYEALSVV